MTVLGHAATEATSSNALSIEATTMSTSRPNLRASNSSRSIRGWELDRVISYLLLEDESRIRPRDERESHSRPTTPPGPVVTVMLRDPPRFPQDREKASS